MSIFVHVSFQTMGLARLVEEALGNLLGMLGHEKMVAQL